MTNIENYFHNNIAPDELAKVREEENGKSDEQLYKELEPLWMEEMGHDEDDDVEEKRPHRAMKIALWATSIAAAIMLVLALTFWHNFYSFRGTALAQRVNVTTNPGEQADVALPDGTHIRLNGGSRLTYPSVFSDKERKVFLSGEGYFVVAHNSKQPFTVSSNGVDVKVLGTEFDFRCLKEEGKSTVVLYKGSVELTATSTGQHATLHPNERAEIDLSNGSVSVSKIEEGDMPYSAWTHHQLVYRDMPLYDVLKSVAINYGLKLKVQSSVANSHFTGTLPDDRIEEVVETLEMVCKIKIRVSGNSLVVNNK